MTAPRDCEKTFFKSLFNEFVYLRTYAKWLPDQKRREKWPETVNRYVSFMRSKLGEKLSKHDYDRLSKAILSHKIVPSMRLLQFAGDATDSSNPSGNELAAYNCSFVAPTNLRDFSDILYILMCGTGVGFSVEKSVVSKLPTIKKQQGLPPKKIVIEDNKEGWAEAFRIGLEALYAGIDVEFDYSHIRPTGTRLKHFGGFSSGPEPLKKLFDFVRSAILQNQGLQLRPIQVLDIIAQTASVVVSGGTRRSALICLSDLDDDELRFAKTGDFYLKNPQRSFVNISAVYNEKPSKEDFEKEFDAIIASGSGERGIFNRGNLSETLPKRRLEKIKNVMKLGTNPCGEILLQNKQLCNLTEVICRPEDTREKLLEKIELATILGTYQASLTNFKYLPKIWEETAKSEYLLGVSLSGVMDCDEVRKPKILKELKEKAIETNEKYAKIFGIKASTAITCVKPSGNTSSVVDCSPGIHGGFSPYYIRRVRVTKKDPLKKLAEDQGVPCFPEVGQTKEDATTFVLEFPKKLSKYSILQDHLGALGQLNHWRMFKKYYTEHNPSVTISVKKDEWDLVKRWVYSNWDIVGGLSFLPASDHVYKLSPYEEITKEEYGRRTKELSNVDLSALKYYEKEDNTERGLEPACAGGGCSID